MAEEQWIVRNNTSGPLVLPANKITFPRAEQDRELCFLTNKSVAELERDPEIKQNLDHKNLITIKKIKNQPIGGETDTSGLSNQLDDLRQLILESSKNQPQQQPVPQAPQQIDTNEIIEAIKGQININIGSQTGENVVSLEDEKMREEALKKLVFTKDDLKKNLKNMGSSKQIENESEGNEDLLDGIDI